MARIRVSHKAEALEKIIESRIRQGRYLQGLALPTERELEKELDFSRGTIRKTYRSLNHRGMVHYHKRRYWVSEEVEELEIDKKKYDHYAVFFSQKYSSPELVNVLEQALRKRKAIPVAFNLDSLEISDHFNFMEYFHTKVKGVYFLSSRIGTRGCYIDKNMLESLPFPYLFIGEEPIFYTQSYLRLDELICVKELIRRLQKEKGEYTIFLPYPLTWTMSKFLHHLTVLAEQEGIALIKKINLYQNSSGRFPVAVNKKNTIVCPDEIYRELQQRFSTSNFLTFGYLGLTSKVKIGVAMEDAAAFAVQNMSKLVQKIQKSRLKYEEKPLIPKLIFLKKP